MASPDRQPTSLDAWIEEQLKNAPNLADHPDKARKIARLLRLGEPASTRRPEDASSG